MTRRSSPPSFDRDRLIVSKIACERVGHDEINARMQVPSGSENHMMINTSRQVGVCCPSPPRGIESRCSAEDIRHGGKPGEEHRLRSFPPAGDRPREVEARRTGLKAGEDRQPGPGTVVTE